MRSEPSSLLSNSFLPFSSLFHRRFDMFLRRFCRSICRMSVPLGLDTFTSRPSFGFAISFFTLICDIGFRSIRNTSREQFSHRSRLENIIFYLTWIASQSLSVVFEWHYGSKGIIEVLFLETRIIMI